ncbi:MAG: nucleotidyltransferase [Verrucomicrobia bacterium]|nr:nucleotidyltransferase [Verrucomicrobiota bacterium]
MSLTLVVLAAGMGSRYGGLKQIEPIGPSGETVLDFAVFDAMRAGFTRVVFVIRRDFETLFREKIGVRYAGRIAVAYVFQSLAELPAGFAPPAGREKPWGTGHAVWCAREAVRENFAVVNADDFYGADSFRQLGKFLAAATVGTPARRSASVEGAGTPSAACAEFAMVGFRLANTLSEHGAVARGVCAAGTDGLLRSVVEQTGINRADVGAGGKYRGDEIVSLNCWGFTPALFAGLDAQFRGFLATLGGRLPLPAATTGRGRGAGTAPPVDPGKTEFYLPAAVSAMIARGAASVRVLPTESVWFGVTYREDRPRVQAAIAGLVREGRYPARLW